MFPTFEHCSYSLPRMVGSRRVMPAAYDGRLRRSDYSGHAVSCRNGEPPVLTSIGYRCPVDA
jgi:hypothetical protein